MVAWPPHLLRRGHHEVHNPNEIHTGDEFAHHNNAGVSRCQWREYHAFTGVAKLCNRRGLSKAEYYQSSAMLDRLRWLNTS